MASYFIFKASDNVTPFAIIEEQTFNTSSTSLTFIGRRRIDYGQAQNQNFLNLLENFASGTQPANPIIGQLWYDSTQGYIKVYDGSSFVKVSNTVASTAEPTPASNGQFWYDTNIGKLKLYHNGSWIIIGPTIDESIAYSIVFGG